MDFKLENWKLDHVNDLVKYGNNKLIADNLRNSFPQPYTLKDGEEFINYCLSNSQNNIFKAIVVNNVAVGSISISKQEDIYCKSAELGYWLAEDFWNQGIMTESIKLITKIAFRDLDIVRIYAEPFVFNKASRKVLEKAGFNLEAILKNSIYKNGSISDSCIYSMIL